MFHLFKCVPATKFPFVWILLQKRRTKRQLFCSCSAGLNFSSILFEVTPQTFLFCLFGALTDKLCLLFVDSAFEAVAPRLQAYIKVPLFPGIPALPDPSGAVCADSRYALHATGRVREVAASGWGLYRFCFMALSTEVVLFVATAMRKEIKLTRGFQADTLIWSSPNPLVPAAPLQVMSLNPPYLPPRPAALVFQQWPLSGPWTDARLSLSLSLSPGLFFSLWQRVCAASAFADLVGP